MIDYLQESRYLVLSPTWISGNILFGYLSANR